MTDKFEPSEGREWRAHRRELRRLRARRRILRSTAALPSLATLGNGVAGFAAIHFATRPLPPAVVASGQEAVFNWISANLVAAAWMVVVALVFDALDGRLARMTRSTSEFGAQLDSLCDAVSFGVAPAVLMLRSVQNVLFNYVGEIDIHMDAPIVGKLLWVIAAIYLCCALMRLARFNVENQPDESSHMYFKGLPSPAAALAVVSLVLLHERLPGITTSPWISQLVIWAMPAITLAAALLMVSRLRYTHVINQYIRGRKPFSYIVKVTIVALAAIFINLQITMTVVTLLFVLQGPVGWLKLKLRHSPAGAGAQEIDKTK